MNLELYIARRLFSYRENKKSISRPIINIAIAGIALGLAVMILSVAIVTGFKQEIRNKVIGFGSHIQITNYDANYSFDNKPISSRQDFLPSLMSSPGIKHIQVFATKAGIIKTADQMEGIVLKGIGPDFDWSFFKNNLVEGSVFSLRDTGKTDSVLVSKKTALLLNLKVGEKIRMYFVPNAEKTAIRGRSFVISGIYETGFEEFDRVFILADIRHIQKLNDWTTNDIGGYEIYIDNFDEIERMTGTVRKIAGFNYNPDGSKLKIQSVKEKYSPIFEWIALFDTNVWVILILMVVVSGFNMISGLLIIILERAKMIGILKSLGAENWSIRKVFLYTGAFLISKGLFWGNLVGIVLCLIQYYFQVIKLDPSSYYVSFVPINLKISHLLLLNAGTLISTIFMLIVPSYLITKISPIKAIQFN